LEQIMNETGVGIKEPLFFIGVIENNFDPRLEGRVQVRAFGVHGTVQQVPTQDLPWATLIYGSYDPNSPIPPLNSWVFGFFIDGRDAQQPMVLGLIPTQMTEAIDPDKTGWGVIDSRNHGLLAQGSRSVDYGQPARSRLARGENVEETYVLAQEAMRLRDVPSANGAPSWEEPASAYNAQYPFNRVIETAAGHSIELDDTPGAERIMVYHRSGSYIQIDTRGTTTHRSQSDRYDITSTNSHVYIGGRSMVTINGDSYVRVNGNKTEEVTGDYTQIVRGNHMLSVGGQLNLNAGDEVQARGAKIRLDANVEGISIKSAKNINIESSQSVHTKAGVAIFIEAANSANLKAGDNIFAQAGAAFNAKSETMFLNSTVALDLKSGHVKLGGGSKVSIDASIVALDDIVQLESGQATAPAGASDATGADEAQGAEMPEPAERSVSVTRHVNRTSMGSAGYASTDEGASDGTGVGSTDGGASSLPANIGTSAIQGPIRPLLDLIAQAESASAGEYNAYNRGTSGGRRLPGNRSVVLTTMLISELQRRQSLPISNPDRIFAAGRYQIIPGTLSDSLARTGISTGELYREQIQDRLALDLLVFRGLNRYLSGSLALIPFGNNLASEWAGLPLMDGPRIGQSKYSAPNEANVSVEAVIRVLEELKRQYDLTGRIINESASPRPEIGSGILV
jgi:hypothetical protein